MMRRSIAAVALALVASVAFAQGKEIKIGVIYDLTGPFAAGGSLAGNYGTKYAIDMINERGGVEGYKIHPIYADAQSKVEVAINEGERLLNQEKVDMLMGFFSSAQCVPMAQKVDQAKRFMWANICVSSAVFKGKNLKYVFRAQSHGDMAGQASCDFLNERSKDLLGKAPKDLRVAIIYEDGPYGSGIAGGNETACKAHGIQIALKEGYSATSPDLSPLVTKLRRARADVILHTGYNPDITLFLRQAKEAGLKFHALIGHGAGYGQFDKLSSTFGKDVNLVFNIDTVGSHLLDPSKLKVKDAKAIIDEFLKRFKKDTNYKLLTPHVSIGFSNAWAFFTDVLPRAIKKHGGIDSEALRKAALETDIPEGGTLQAYGVKFFPPGHELANQNARAYPVVSQYVGDKTIVVWPKAAATGEPILKFPKGHAYAR
jgi:branched-chain amino acid transport system substrate-binding protein